MTRRTPTVPRCARPLCHDACRCSCTVGRDRIALDCACIGFSLPLPPPPPTSGPASRADGRAALLFRACQWNDPKTASHALQFLGHGVPLRAVATLSVRSLLHTWRLMHSKHTWIFLSVNGFILDSVQTTTNVLSLWTDLVICLDGSIILSNCDVTLPTARVCTKSRSICGRRSHIGTLPTSKTLSFLNAHRLILVASLVWSGCRARWIHHSTRREKARPATSRHAGGVNIRGSTTG